MLVGGYPEVVAMVQDVRQRLAPFGGLHLTPLQWLHITTLIAGPAEQISSADIQQMAQSAARLLATTAPITVRLGKILYHPEAIMLAATPATALTAVRKAALTATREITGTGGQPESRPWAPHITVCYSTTRQAAGPIVSALGRDLPERHFQVSAVSLIIQQGPERAWDWHPVATVRLGT
jgi:2'-5' RNA ligase